MSKLIPPLDRRDHIQGSLNAPIVLVEFGDYQCPSCKAAYRVVTNLQTELADQLCFAFRHFPLVDIHPYAEAAAEAAEAAGEQGRFWEMHGLLFQNSPALAPDNLLVYATDAGLDVRKLAERLASHRYLPRVRQHFESGVRSGVPGTPAFFINGVRHEGGFDLESMLEALKATQQALR